MLKAETQLALPMAVASSRPLRRGVSPERARELFAWMRRHVERCCMEAALERQQPART